MAHPPLTLTEAADELGVHYMTAYRYIRTGRLPATRVGGVWQVDRADLALVRRSGTGPRGRQAGGAKPSRARLEARLEARLVAGDEAGAWSLLEAALASDKSPTDVLLELVTPAMRAIGTRWEQGELSVADEHRASAVAVRLVSRLGARFARRGVKRGTVVLAAPAGEQHAVPVAIAANLLRWAGFDVAELGANTPAEAMIETVVGQPDLVALGIVCTTDAATRAAAGAITKVRRASPDIPILLGGAAVADADQARRLGADVYTGARADEVVRAVEAIVTGAA